MKFEHKALSFALALAALIPACYVVSEKPADSAPPAAPVAAGGAAAVPVATPTVPPLTTTTAATPVVPPHPPSLHAAKPLPTTMGTGGAGGLTGTGGATP